MQEGCTTGSAPTASLARPLLLVSDLDDTLLRAPHDTEAAAATASFMHLLCHCRQAHSASERMQQQSSVGQQGPEAHTGHSRDSDGGSGSSSRCSDTGNTATDAVVMQPQAGISMSTDENMPSPHMQQGRLTNSFCQSNVDAGDRQPWHAREEGLGASNTGSSSGGGGSSRSSCIGSGSGVRDGPHPFLLAVNTGRCGSGGIDAYRVHAWTACRHVMGKMQQPTVTVYVWVPLICIQLLTFLMTNTWNAF